MPSHLPLSLSHAFRHALVLAALAAAGSRAQQIQAEAWTTMSGLQTEATTDAGGGLNVGWIDPNDWAEYRNVAMAAGDWKVEARIATMATARSIQVWVDGVQKTTITHAGNTGGWQAWVTTAQTAAFNVAAGGNHTVRLVFPVNNLNLNWIRLVPVTPPVGGNLLSNGDFSTGYTDWILYQGTQLNFPGEYAVNAPATTNVYDVNVWQRVAMTQGTAYTLTFRARSNTNKTIVAGWGFAHAPWTNQNQTYALTPTWQDFTFNPAHTVPTDADSRVFFDVGGATAGEVHIDDVVLTSGTVDTQAPNAPGAPASPSQTTSSITLDWPASTSGDVVGYTVYNGTTTASPVATLGNVLTHTVTGLAAGTSFTYTVRARDAAGNISVASPSVTASTLPVTGGPVTIQAEAWTTMLGLQTEATTDAGGGLNVGWIDANDWAEYAGQSIPAGTYKLEARMATMATARSIQLFVDGTLRTTVTQQAMTGGWQTWVTAVSTDFTLTGTGNRLVRIGFPVNNLNLNWIRFVPSTPDVQAPDKSATPTSPARSGTTIDLAWTVTGDNVGVTGYEIHVNGALRQTTGAVTAAQITGLTPLTAYAIRILAFDAAGNKGALSDPLNVSTTDAVNLEGVFVLKNRSSGKCVDLAGQSLVNGGNVHQWTCNGSPFQKWRFERISGDDFRVRNIGSGLLMDVQGAGATDNVQQWGTTDGGPAQRWRILAQGDGSHAFNALSDLTECLDVAGASPDDGANVQVYACNSTLAQKYDIVPTTANTVCWAGDAPGSSLAAQEYWPAVPFVQPLEIVQEPPASGNAFFVLDWHGTVRRVLNDPADAGNRTFFSMAGRLRTTGESGLASMAFDPEYGISNRYLYLTYISNVNNELRLSRLTANSTGTSVDLATEVVLFRFVMPSDIHTAGALAFGPGPVAGARYLYMSVGDNGNNQAGDTNPVKATQMNQPHGKILRLAQADYRSAGQLPWNYASGASNAYIVAKGLRNPWRISCDGDELWITNVGFDKIEEINRFNVKTEAGVDFGWPYCEGDVCCAQGINCALPGLPPMPGNLRAPFFQYPRSEGTTGEGAVIGGLVYRGSALPALYGKYIYADFVDKTVFSLDPATKARVTLLNNAGDIADIGTDAAGEIYLVDYGRSNVYRMVPGQGGGGAWPPQNLMDWGCFTSLGNGDPVPAAGVRPFEVAQRFWSDSADKERFVAIPEATKIDNTDPDNWILPPGGVTVKNFFWHGSIFETRLFVRHTNGTHAGYTYRWDSPTAATLVPAEGGSKDLGSLVWNYPSRAQCITCHTNAVNGSIALETRQVNVNGQLAGMAQAGLLANASPAPLAPYPAVNDWTVPVAERAQAYMHVNCANCHRGPTASEAGRAVWDARYNTPLAGKRACNEIPVESMSGNPEERIVKPGNHTLSTLWLRAHQRENRFMPPLGSQVPDTEGVNLLRDWMNALTGCP